MILIASHNARVPCLASITTTTAAALARAPPTLSATHAVAALSLRCSHPSSPPRALLHTTPVYLKKDKSKGKSKGGGGGTAAAPAASEKNNNNDDDDGGAKHPTPSPEEPLNFADVESRIKQQDERFTTALKKLRSGGRFNPDVIGALRVPAPDAPKGSGTTYALRELAQIVPRPGGRSVSLLAHEASSVRAIMSAVQASPDFNQQPQRDPDNELELVLKVEAESRDEAARRVRAACHEWRERIRSIRQRRDKLHAAWRKEGSIGPDLKHTADKHLDKVIKAKIAAIDSAEKEALKAADSGR